MAWFRSSSLLFVLACAVSQQEVSAVRSLRFASPLQSLTIPDPEVKASMETKRQTAVGRFRAGLKAEKEARQKIASERTKDMQAAATSGKDWANRAARSERERREEENNLVEAAYDKSVADFEAESAAKALAKSKSSNKYQFVGVVKRNDSSSDKPITWYARSKPEGSKWSVRLLHVNQDAIIKDLFNRGKVDIFAKYENTGKVDEEKGTPIITSKYEVRERSWKNLWNFSPKHFFSDPSGMYWRERRLQPGLYTDGVSVYESSYRYKDGRNGMHRVSGFQQFLSSKSINSKEKETILERLQTDAPDVVLEL